MGKILKEHINIRKTIKKIPPLLKRNKTTVLTLFGASILIDIFLLNKSSDLITFTILSFYVFFIKLFKIKSKQTFLLCIGLLIVMFINFLFTGPSIPAEKAAVWLVLFLTVGVIQQWKE